MSIHYLVPACEKKKKKKKKKKNLHLKANFVNFATPFQRCRTPSNAILFISDITETSLNAAKITYEVYMISEDEEQYTQATLITFQTSKPTADSVPPVLAACPCRCLHLPLLVPCLCLPLASACPCPYLPLTLLTLALTLVTCPASFAATL